LSLTKLRFASHRDDAVQFPGHAGAGDRGVRNKRQAFPRGVINHRQNPEPAAIGELVVNKIKVPAIIDPSRPRDWSAKAKRALAAFTLPHAKLLFPVEPENALVVHLEPLPPQKNMKPPVAKPPPLMSQTPQPIPQALIVAAP
jgi:hypothetical protein